MPETLLWEGPEYGEGETLRLAFRRLSGRDFEPGRCQWEQWAAGYTVFHYRDGWEVTVAEGGRCSISRESGEGGGGG